MPFTKDSPSHHVLDVVIISFTKEQINLVPLHPGKEGRGKGRGRGRGRGRGMGRDGKGREGMEGGRK